MGLLLGDPFWLSPDAVTKLTHREIWHWYVDVAINRGKRVKEEINGPSVAGGVSPEDQAANIAMLFPELDRKRIEEEIRRGNGLSDEDRKKAEDEMRERWIKKG